LPDIDDLKFIQTFDFRHVPQYLFEQSKDFDDDTIDRIYTFFKPNMTTLLYVLVDEGYKIKGVLWASISIFEAVICIKFLSVDKEYQTMDGRLLNKVKDFLFGLKIYHDPPSRF